MILLLFWLSANMRWSFRAKSSPACVKSTLIGCVFALLISYRMLVRHLDEERRSRLRTVVLTFTSKASPVANASSLPMGRSEEHTSELQSLMRNSSAVIGLKKKKQNQLTILSD